MSEPGRTSADRVVVTDDGVRLHTRTDGPAHGPPLLLCNSLGTDHTLWDTQVPAWSEHRRVVRFDQRGHGASEVGPTPYTLARLGADALAVLDAWEIDRADVCGISLGGMVALWLAVHAPERVGRVVAADTAGRVGTEEGWRDRAALVREHGMATVKDAVLERFFSPAFRSGAPDEVARVGDTILGCDPEGYAGSCDALATADLRPALTRVGAPVLVVVGTEDVATTPDDAAALAAAVPGAQLVELPDAGHLANVERPQRFAELVTDHLDDRAGDPASLRSAITDRGGTT